MVFNRSANAGFFLTLEDNDSQSAGVVLNPGEPAASAPDPIEPAADSQPVAVVTPVAAPSTTAASESADPPDAAVATTASVQTTAEAIAAELAAAEAARPPGPLTTFAPDNLMPGNALRQQRRRPGAAMKGFRVLASDLFKS